MSDTSQDEIALSIIRQYTESIPSSITLLGELSRDQFYHVCAVLFSAFAVPVDLNLPADAVAKMKPCRKLTTLIKEKGYGSMNSQLFYDHRADLVEAKKLISWLINQLPKTERSDDATAMTTDDMTASNNAHLSSNIVSYFKQWCSVSWSPLCGVSPPQQLYTKSLVFPSSSAGPHVDYHRDALRTVPRQIGENKYQASLLSHHVYELILTRDAESTWSSSKATKLENQQRLNSLLKSSFSSAFNSKSWQDSNLFNASNHHISSAFTRRTVFENEHDGDASTSAHDKVSVESGLSAEEIAAKLQQEREQQLEALQQSLNDLISSTKNMESNFDSYLSQLQQRKDDMSSLDSVTTSAEDAYKAKKKAIDLLPDAQNNLLKLQAMVDATNARLKELQNEWENYRQPLLAKLKRHTQLLQERKEEVGKKIEMIKRMREEMKEKAIDLREKDTIYKQVLEELNSLPKSINRQVYVKRIMDLMKMIDNLKAEIKRILDDIKRIQKDINLISESSTRSFAICDEVVFQTAKKNSGDAVLTKVYKYVIELREGFVDIVASEETKGKIVNAYKELEAQVIDLENRNKNLDEKRVMNDLAQVKKENENLTKKLQKAKK